MKSVYILSNESRIVKATVSLDEATLWKSNGGMMVEVPFTEDDNNAVEIEDENVIVKNEDDETIATFTPEVYDDPIEHLLNDFSVDFYEENYSIGRIVFGKTLLENINITDDLKKEIIRNCEEIATMRKEH